ncbi:hypothetical protein KKB44_03530, partial [Candidatus Micrarchaeota archaeon]|nr:hypothetical protein [Candidatus Micrarchaeota archaeon]
MTRRLEHSKRGPEKKTNKSLVAGSVLGAATITAVALPFLLRSCGPAEEGPRSEPETPTIEAPAEVPAPVGPVRGDGRCEVDKGEHDPFSPTFDAEACGFCGDDVCNAAMGETAVTCLVDCHCGDGVEQNRVATGTYVEVSTDDGITYKFDSVTVDESCRTNSDRYCEADCPQRNERSSRDRSTNTGRGATETPREVAACGSDVTGSGAAEGIETTVRGVVSGRANALREQMGASSSANVMVSVTL